VCVAVAACAPARPPPREPLREVCAPVPPCPSWTDALRENAPKLRLHVIDSISGDGCPNGASVTVEARLDGASIGAVTFSCRSAELRAPPPHNLLEGRDVMPGMHELALRTQLPGGSRETTVLVSLPAFDVLEDGKSLMLGAEILVDVSRDDVTIGPPQVYAPHGL